MKDILRVYRSQFGDFKNLNESQKRSIKRELVRNWQVFNNAVLKDFAEHSELSTETISRWFNGKGLTISSLEKIAKGLDLDFSDIIDLEITDTK